MSEINPTSMTLPSTRIEVVEKSARSRKGWLRCEEGENITFSTVHLETYCLAQWEPIVYDALLLAAAVEIADRTLHRPALRWEREIEIRVPVHDLDRWNEKRVTEALHGTLNFLTGDRWHVTFVKRRRPAESPTQGVFNLPEGLAAVILSATDLTHRLSQA